MEHTDIVAAVIGRYVHKHGGGTAQQVRTGIGPRYRAGFVEGAAYAVKQRWVRLDGDVLLPGVVTPPARGALGDLAAQIRAAAEA